MTEKNEILNDLKDHINGVSNNVFKRENDENSEAKTKRIKQESETDSHDTLHHLIKRQHVKSTIMPSPKRHLSELMYIEHHENGGGFALHAYADELAHLDKVGLNALVRKFFRTLFAERRKRPFLVPFSYYCIGVIHGAAQPMPELLNYLSQVHSNLNITTNQLESKNSTFNMPISEYVDNAFKNYNRGTFRYGPLHAISIVGTKGEERGTFSEDLLRMVEADPFLRAVTPWGPLSKYDDLTPGDSDDGPILWTRPGEQCLSVRMPKKLSNLLLTTTSGRTGNLRQTLIPDRTPCHADHADDGLNRHTTAAVGILKAVIPPSSAHKPAISDELSKYYQMCSKTNTGRICKDVVVFDPRHYPDLVRRLGLDIMEPPMSQCGSFWADDGELNQLRAEGYRYVRLPLRDNDIYFIPRNVVHQFKTVSAVTSIAWHVRLKSYYDAAANTPSAGTSTIRNHRRLSTPEHSDVPTTQASMSNSRLHSSVLIEQQKSSVNDDKQVCPTKNFCSKI